MDRFFIGCLFFIGWLLGVSALNSNFSSSEATAGEHQAGGEQWKDRGPHKIASVEYEWKDLARQREVPVKIYFPKMGNGPFPVIVFSHGLGGSREGYAYLGRQWTSHGYVVAHVQHRGSDIDVWKGADGSKAMLRAAAQDPANAINRPKDLSFALDQLHKLQRESSPLTGRLDLERIGAAGHSFGGHTTLAVSGQVFIGPLGGKHSQGDPRVKAMIVMSGPGPKRKDRLDEVYGRITIPGLHMTGTRDESPIGLTAVADRRIPFDQIRGADQYLVIFEGGDHMVFSGMRRLRQDAKDAVFQDLILMTTTAFWDAYLKGDAKAKNWLAAEGFSSVVRGNGTFEKKLQLLEGSK